MNSDTNGNGKSNGHKKEGEANGNGNGRNKNGTEDRTEKNTRFHSKCRLWYSPHGFHMHTANCTGDHQDSDEDN